MHNFLIVVVAGFFGSYHCAGMCSPITGLLPDKRFYTLLLYNGGRIFTYAFLGFLAGYGGLSFTGLFKEIQPLTGIFAMFAGLVMIILGVIILLKGKGRLGGVFYPVYETIGDIIQVMTGKGNSLASPFLVGVFNGLLPCPMVYIFLFQAAATFDPFYGMLTMLSLGMGTLPVMLFSGSILKKWDIWRREQITYLLAGIVIYLGVVSIVRGTMLLISMKGLSL